MREDERSGGSRGTTIFQAAVALFCGSALGASGALPLGVARALVLATPLAALLARLALARCHLRRGLTARGILLSLLVLGASLRAGVGTYGGSPSAEATVVGTWRPMKVGNVGNVGNGGNGGGSASDRDHGSIEGETPGFAFLHGTVAAGEEVAVLSGEGAPAFARGPEPGPSRAGGGPRSSRERAPDEVVRLGSRDAGICDRAVAALERVRAGLLERAARLGDPLTRGLVSGLLLGDLSEIPRGVGDLFVRTGTFHILAISGLQVALVAVLLVGPIARALAFLLRALTRGRVRDGSQALSAILLLLFVPVAGAGPPVLRSALTFVVGSLAPRLRVSRRFDASTGDASTGDASAGDASASDETGRRRHFMVRSSDPLSIWSLALVLECLVHPDAPLSASVQLTYAATFGLIVASGPIRALLCRGLPNGGRLSATSSTGRTRPELPRILAQKVCDASIQAVAASLAAVLATLAVVWARFGEWSPVGVLATPAIAFPVAWMLVVGWIWLLAPSLVPQVLLDVPGRAMIHLLEAFDRIPGSPCELPPRPLGLLLAASALTVLALARRRGSDGPAPSARAWSARGAALLWAAILVPWARAPSSLEVHALDVGHGTAAVIRSPGGAVWVFDAGSRDRPDVDREALAPLLRAWDASRIGIVLSHPDRDHDGAMGWLVERFPPLLWAGALPAQIDARLPHTVPRADIGQGRMKLPSLDCEGGSEGDPGGGTLGLELSRGLDIQGNEGSRCLEITWRGDRIVLSGDAEAEGLAAWLASRPPRGPVRVLLFPHHGSDTNLVAPLVAALRPTEIWISASGTPGIAKELERRGIPCRITSVEGPLELALP